MGSFRIDYKLIAYIKVSQLWKSLPQDIVNWIKKWFSIPVIHLTVQSYKY